MAEPSSNSRLEAFCDGVFAIAITLLIIDIRIPSTKAIESTGDFWRVLMHLAPSIFAFVLSFTIILITWVNHHATLKLIKRSSVSFIYANGFLLLTVAFLPFPTSLLGEYVLTDHASPAVILYVGTMALTSVGWILLTSTALNNRLLDDENSIRTIGMNRTYGYVAFVVYSLCALIAVWFPLTIACVTIVIWICWLILGITLKHE